ncbi:ABC transporter ATP-binding protein [Streptomyces sp. NBC_00264]|uniref:ABC transporter ATP-binding protein n=1 Tax=unclassified Streptomyces TaxID=2593676 RepID=UPI0022531758|nr:MULTISPECIES: ABC transporter ATP-binding protein [unclassified Streptomyces]WSX03197.1 ABC transporter ATP-binding protein [Streptomyces sp. NBC_00987]MCX4394838.1 ABC transporter ATP-binding protein [Streptomyces sp. NBC_01767]MCX5162094.1 ABC transporter ATP-binding protein [Streptomyces sp. NBC_00305]MCX5220611.1 ABC transporter ATP-binding protein [Streptomyces sp. NBC_00264]WSC28502.1 ABC transporter ATP-binding protein [Streptomyces sp. NBC_01768]
MIDIENLSKVFDDRTLWRDVNFTVKSGEMLALVGPSGSGKSTLLNCLGLLEKPSGGKIHYKGSDITRFGRRDILRFRRDTLGYLFQQYALIENATVDENLEVVTTLQRSLRGTAATAIAEALDRVGLAGRGKEKICHLSGGEQQRVALARLVVQQPDLVLADEPTGALDDANTSMVVDILHEMSRGGCAVVIATHDAGVRDRCDAVFAVDESALVTLHDTR